MTCIQPKWSDIFPTLCVQKIVLQFLTLGRYVQDKKKLITGCKQVDRGKLCMNESRGLLQ